MKKIMHLIWILICTAVRVQFNGKTSGGPLAVIKYGQIIAEARGKIAGMVFSRNTAGAYMRTKVTPINPKTATQTAVRALMTTVSQGWRGITEAQRLAWDSIAPLWTHTNIFGDNVPLTGFGLYCRLNRNLQTIGEAMIAVAPAPNAITGLDTLSVVADTTGGTLDITWTPATPATQNIILSATAPLSAGKKFVKSEYRFLLEWDDAVASPQNVGGMYVPLFGALPPIGTRVFVRLKPVIRATGQDGVMIEASDVAI